jgi:hypothetical protein
MITRVRKWWDSLPDDGFFKNSWLVVAFFGTLLVMIIYWGVTNQLPPGWTPSCP